MSEDQTSTPTAPDTQEIFISEYQKKLMAQWERTHGYKEIVDGKETVMCPPAPIQIVGNACRWVNRKERRRTKAFARRAPDKRPKYDLKQAILGAIKSMIQSPVMGKKLMDGELDAYLPEGMTQDRDQLLDKIKEHDALVQKAAQG